MKDGDGVGGLAFRPTLTVVTHDQGRLEKKDCFGGIYCCLRGLIGPPVVPDC